MGFVIPENPDPPQYFPDGKVLVTVWKAPGFYVLVLIDIMMPKMDGFQLYENLKKIDPSIKVCFLTASEMYYGERRELEHCAFNKDVFLQKPISTDDLVKEVNKKINSI